MLSDADYADFVQHMVESDFKPNRRTDEVLKVLRDAARLEGCYERAEEAFGQLEAALKGDLKTDLEAHREDIRPYLEDEIVSRYYYQRGRALHLLKSDTVLDRAVELLKSEDEYRRILGPTKKN